jgi:hypothetical protein
MLLKANFYLSKNIHEEAEYKSFLSCLHSKSLSFFESFFQSALHVKGSFWIIIALSLQQS